MKNHSRRYWDTDRKEWVYPPDNLNWDDLDDLGRAERMELILNALNEELVALRDEIGHGPVFGALRMKLQHLVCVSRSHKNRA